MWYKLVEKLFIFIKMTRNSSNHNMYDIGTRYYEIILVFYVENFLIKKGHLYTINWLKEQLKKEFDMINLNLVAHYPKAKFNDFNKEFSHIARLCD